jgi:hypothetical protein
MSDLLLTANKLRVFDGFNRADSTNIGSADTGQLWTEVADCQVLDNRLTSVVATGGFVTLESELSNVKISAICNIGADAVGITRTVGLAARFTNSDNYWQAQLLRNADGSTQTLRIQKIEASAVSTMASKTISINASTEYVLEFTLLGDSIKASVDGVEHLSISNAFNQTATIIGIRLTSTGGATPTSYADDLRVKEV